MCVCVCVCVCVYCPVIIICIIEDMVWSVCVCVGGEGACFVTGGDILWYVVCGWMAGALGEDDTLLSVICYWSGTYECLLFSLSP